MTGKGSGPLDLLNCFVLLMILFVVVLLISFNCFMFLLNLFSWWSSWCSVPSDLNFVVVLLISCSFWSYDLIFVWCSYRSSMFFRSGFLWSCVILKKLLLNQYTPSNILLHLYLFNNKNANVSEHFDLCYICRIQKANIILIRKFKHCSLTLFSWWHCSFWP